MKISYLQNPVVHKLLLFLTLVPALSYADIMGRVVAVADGDTIKVLDDNRTEHKVRLSGIDAPERGQPYGNVSRENLAKLVAGKDVRVETVKKDRYGRVVGKIWVQPGDCPTCGKTLDANHAQLLAGMAWWYRYYARKQSPVRIPANVTARSGHRDRLAHRCSLAGVFLH